MQQSASAALTNTGLKLEDHDRAIARAGAEHRIPIEIAPARACASDAGRQPVWRCRARPGDLPDALPSGAAMPMHSASGSTQSSRTARAASRRSRTACIIISATRRSSTAWSRPANCSNGHACSAGTATARRARRSSRRSRDGKDVVFDIDWQGHRQLRAALPGRCGRRVHPAADAGRAGARACAAARATMRRRSPGACGWRATRSAIGRNSTMWW